jgi:hypothetical protein
MNTAPRAATNVRMSVCRLPGAIAAWALLVIVLTQALLKPRVEEPSIWLALIWHPTIMHKGSNTATIAMMITIAIETLRMSAGAYTDSFRLQQLRSSHNNYRAAATRTEAVGAH